MAQDYGNDSLSRTMNQEYHPLNDLSPAYWSRPNATSASQDADYVSAYYLTGDISDYHGDGIAQSLTESSTAAHPPLDSSTLQFVQPRHVSGIPKGPAQFTLRDWQWEFGACIFSLGCFAAVVGVLASYDTKSLASWDFVFGITLNTLIAILSTLSRTTLLVPVTSCISQLKWIHLIAAPRPLREVQVFDDASRGPWGSLELIWKLHIRTKLATWGSIITILTLAMGPFTQQLLSYPSRSVISGNAMYYTSHVYDSAWGEGRGLRGGTGQISELPEDCSEITPYPNLALLASTMGPKMQGAILNGLFNLSSPVQFTCTTGNCRWDEFSTLAVTSSCQNVTSQTVVQCERSGSALNCNYTTPAGFFIGAASHQSSGGAVTTSFNSTAFKPLSYGNSPMDSRKELINSTLARIALANLQGSFNMSSPDILECDIRLCARLTNNLTVTNGTFETGNSNDIELEGVPGRWDADQQAGVGYDTRDYYTFNITGDHPTFPGNHSFSYHMIDIEGVKNYLYNIFTTGYEFASEGDISPYYWPLMNSSDHTKTVAAISQSMSYAMAQAPSGETLEGRAFISELYIQVQWSWIILPLAEVVMSIGLLVCTLGYTRHKGVPAWKSSGIVPLLTVMMGWDNSELRATSARDIGKRSQFMRGQLVTNHGDIQAFYRTD